MNQIAEKLAVEVAASPFVKVGADGSILPFSAPEWAAVLDTRTDLMWSAQETDSMTWAAAKVHCEGLQLAGSSCWRLPTVEELFLFADRTRHRPAIDTNFFPACQSDWYWSGTPEAEEPGDYAWVVYFGSGFAVYSLQGGGSHVRAVRPRQ